MPIKARWPESRSQEAVDVLLQIAFGTHSHDLSRDLATLEKQQRWNGADAVFRGQSLLLVNIDFSDANATVVFAGKLVKQRADHFAWTAPLGPKIDDYRTWNAKDLFGKIGLA
jgi:hypothetical protein